MKPTLFQSYVQNRLGNGNSLMLIAPTGLGKTLAVTGDMEERFCKTVYAVPLRALATGIQKEISNLKRNGKNINAVIHHGDIQESALFGEEAIITTYDQVVCGVPGLPLSFSLKAGHAIAGALLMSRLILDETHLAWSISDQALSILLAIIKFRQHLGLQTVILTATLPTKVVQLIADELGLELVVAGEGELSGDKSFELRNNNRNVTISKLILRNIGKSEGKKLDWGPLDKILKNHKSKRIYFANTVGRLQDIFDRLVSSGMDANNITVLHNRMPRSWRSGAEKRVHERFGKNSQDGDWLLLTNQVAEAGLDISAPLVISDPAPVDTLLQRAGRCGRWFRKKEVNGDFKVINAPKVVIEDRKAGLAIPYKAEFVLQALSKLPEGRLTWEEEQTWINSSWGGKKPLESVKKALDETTFALNLFDRAAQEHKPGTIAAAFRDILSVEVAVEEGDTVYVDDLARRNLQEMLVKRQYPETSSVSLGRAWSLIREAPGRCAVIRYNEDGEFEIAPTDSVKLGEILVVPSSIAYLHKDKGLCFGNGTQVKDAILYSNWLDKKEKDKESFKKDEGKRQTLWKHTAGVMNRVKDRLTSNGMYRKTLWNLLQALEPEKDTGALGSLVASLGILAAGFHDLGKCDRRWQEIARNKDPESGPELIGRTANVRGRIGVPHTPPGYNAMIAASELLIGSLNSSEYLIRSLALSGIRHHSSLLNPAMVKHKFDPDPKTLEFIKSILKEINAPESVLTRVDEILNAAKNRPSKDEVPLLLPNVDLFPIYALIGRAILMSDREDAAGKPLEIWRSDT